MTFQQLIHRRIQRIRHELRSRSVQVAAIEPLGKSFVRIHFEGEDLADFVSSSFDDHVKIFFHNGAGEPRRRDYTPRSFNPRQHTLAIEFVRHGHGDAAEWAQQARVGDRLQIGGPRGSMVIPMDYDWHLLVADASALPAVSRRLEELPAGTKVQVLGWVDHAEDQRDFATQANVQVQWVRTADALCAALQAWTPPAGDGFSWCAGEGHAMARVRRILLEEKHLPKESMKVAAYWKQGLSDFHERLDD